MKIKIATDFSRIPEVRYPEEGEVSGNSGQEFRNNILLPKLKESIKNKEKLEIDLDGTAGLGSSFLEESFGGLIRIDKIAYSDIVSTIVFISKENPDYIEEIMEYLNDANEKENN